MSDEQKSGLDQFREMLPTLTDDGQKAGWLKWATDQDTDDQSLPPAEVDFVRSFARDKSGFVRAAAVQYLATKGPVSWDELESWLLDPAEEVRLQVLQQMGSEFDAVGTLCATDLSRSIDLVIKSYMLFPHVEADLWLREMAERDDATFDAVWRAAETVLDCENFDAISAIVIGFFEDVIPDRNWGPDDRHIQPWIEGDEWNRKAALLNIGEYLHLNYGKTREIVEALSRDTNPEIADRAKRILAEDAPVSPTQEVKHKWKRRE